MNPIVLIVTHNRVEITTRNIKDLLSQSVRPKVCLVVSEDKEFWDYSKKFNQDDVHVTKFGNNPLGNKWLHGVLLYQDANPLIICGSDDILGDGFIENACGLIEQGNHFVGLRRWWQHKEGKAYLCQYKAKDNFPLGGGRAYSAEMLETISYQVFDPTADKHLDDLGWHNARKSGLKCLVLDEPEKEGLSIHAIKGDWPVMNPFTINHPNIRLIKTEQSKKVLPSFYE